MPGMNIIYIIAHSEIREIFMQKPMIITALVCLHGNAETQNKLVYDVTRIE